MGLIVKLIRMVPVLGPVLHYVRTNCQLVLGWAILGVLLAMSGYAMSLWGKTKTLELNMLRVETELTSAKRDADDLKFELETIRTANQDLSTALANVTKLQIQTDTIVNQLVVDMMNNQRNTKKVQDAVRNLEKNREDFKKYLDERIPFDLSCLRTNTCQEHFQRNSQTDHRKDAIRQAYASENPTGRYAVYTYHAIANQPGLTGRLDRSWQPLRRMPVILRETPGMDEDTDRKPLTDRR